MNKPKDWVTCYDCGLKFFPNAKTERWAGGITCHEGTCPDCGVENATLIPISDYRYACGDFGQWD